jgi:inorganic pyrophosphatase
MEEKRGFGEDRPPLIHLPAWDKKTGLLQTIVETPKGARNKFAFDEQLGLFRLKKILPMGMAFPFHFGFVPSTWAEDDGPLDVLILLEEPAFPGCLVPARLLGAIEAKQTKKGKAIRNDRLIAAAEGMPSFERYRSINDMGQKVLKQIEEFFVSYNAAEGKEFKVLRRSGPKEAARLLAEGGKAFKVKYGQA